MCPFWSSGGCFAHRRVRGAAARPHQAAAGTACDSSCTDSHCLSSLLPEWMTNLQQRTDKVHVRDTKIQNLKKELKKSPVMAKNQQTQTVKSRDPGPLRTISGRGFSRGLFLNAAESVLMIELLLVEEVSVHRSTHTHKQTRSHRGGGWWDNRQRPDVSIPSNQSAAAAVQDCEMCLCVKLLWSGHAQEPEHHVKKIKCDKERWNYTRCEIEEGREMILSRRLGMSGNITKAERVWVQRTRVTQIRL